MNKQLDEILDFCFEGEVSWTRDQLEGTSYYKESMENIDKRKAEARVKLQKLFNDQKKAFAEYVVGVNEDETTEEIDITSTDYGERVVPDYFAEERNSLRTQQRERIKNG